MGPAGKFTPLSEAAEWKPKELQQKSKTRSWIQHGKTLPPKSR